MGQALYRKYRSKSLKEIVGQEHITGTLEKALKSGRISHAYLFTGPRGVGKTSVARILAYEVNGLEYDDTTQLDIIEIDAASNRRIDEIRDLRDRVNVAPASAKYKVYIIDEVHMLTKEAFNALLKTLEEPPAHVIFILATTESHKLPETIISRTQRFSFRPASHEQIIKHLKNISKTEKITIDDEALSLIAEHADGSFRDSISLLDQARNNEGEINRQTIEQMLGLAPAELISNLKTAVEQRQAAAIVTALAELAERGYEAAMIATQLSETWRQTLLTGETALGANATMGILKDLLDVPGAREPKRTLELILLKPALENGVHDQLPLTATAPAEPKPRTIPKTKTTTSETEEPAEEAHLPVTPESDETDLSNEEAEALWQQVVASIKKEHNTLYGIVRMAHAQFDGSTLKLLFAFAFHKKRASEPKNQKVIADTLHEVTGQVYQIICEVSDKPLPEKPAASLTDQTENEVDPAISTISNIFGGAELLES